MAIIALISQPSCFILANMSRAEEPNCGILSIELICASFSYKTVRCFFLWIPLGFSVSLPEQEEQEEQEVQRLLLKLKLKLWECLPSAWLLKPVKALASLGRVLMGRKYGGATGGRHYGVSCTLWTTFFAKWSILFSENSVGSSCGVAAELNRTNQKTFFLYVCPAILGYDTIKEKLHLQTLCDSLDGWDIFADWVQLRIKIRGTLEPWS